MKFDHIGVFVHDIEEARVKFDAVLPGYAWGRTFDDDVLHARFCFGEDAAGLRYELVAPFGSPNPVSGILESGRNILNHVAYRVPDLNAAASTLRATGAVPTGPPQPAIAFGGALVMFFWTELGFMIELIEHA